MNLLVVFAETMRHQRLTVVAERLGQTQSAISHAIARLRDILDDPLFIRRPHGVEPTPRAVALEPKIRAIIDLAREALASGAPFDPATSTAELRIAAQDYHCALFAAPLLAAAEREAPGLNLTFLPMARQPALHALERGEVEIAIGFLRAPNDSFVAEPLFDQGYAVVARAHHPRLAQLATLDGYCGERHLIVSQSGERRGIADQALAKLGRERRVVAALPYFLAALATVSRTDLVATLPRALVEAFATHFSLAVVEPPVALRRFPVAVVRHRRSIGNGAVDWVLGALASIPDDHDGTTLGSARSRASASSANSAATMNAAPGK